MYYINSEESKISLVLKYFMNYGEQYVLKILNKNITTMQYNIPSFF